MTLTRIHHVALVVRDADQALAFYRDLLGLRVALDRVIEDQGVRGILLPMAGDGGANAPLEIEIVQPINDDTGVAKFLAKHGEGLHHVCLQSTDVAADLIAAKAAGQTMIDETPRDGMAGRIGFLHPKSNFGHLVELAQPPTNAPADAHDAGVAPQGPVAPIGLDHLVSVVNDPALASAHFQTDFGFTETGATEQEAMNVSSRLVALGGSVVELATPLVPSDADPLTRLLQKGEGLLMIALGVADVPAAVEHLRAAGVKCTDPAVMSGKPRAFLSPKPANGVRLQLVGF